MTISRHLGVILVVLLLAGCSAAPRPAAAPAPQRADGDGSRATTAQRAIVAVRESPTQLNGSLNSNADTIEELISAGLVNFDPRGVPTPQLAVAVPSLENGQWKLLPDGKMETTWSIRPEAQWHDGKPVTTDDLLFTTLVGRDRELPDFGHRGYGSIEAVTAIDSRTVAVTWNKIYIQADYLFSSLFALPLPKHLLEASYFENKAAFTQLGYWTQDFIGTGPFKVRDFVRDDHVTLEANPNYVLGRPKLAEIEVKFISDGNTLIANLLAGTVDASLGRGLSIEQSLQIREQWRDGALVVSPYFGALVAFPQFLNPDPPLLANVQFRRALVHAIDRETIMETVQGGLTAVTGFTISPASPDYPQLEPSIVNYSYDPRRAAQLLDGTGLVRGPDGFYRDSAGQEVPVEVRAIAGDDTRERTMFAMADYWQRVGLRGTPRVVTPEQGRDRGFIATRPAFDVSGMTIDMSDPSRMVWLHSAEAQLPENNFRTQNKTRYQNPELDAIVDRFFITVPRPERLDLMKQFARHVTDQVVIVPVFHTAFAILVNNRLQNVTPRTQRTQAWRAHEWSIGS